MARQAPSVDAFMAALDHPMKAEVQTVRAIIQGVDPRITEEIKWNAPTFSYKGYLVTLDLHAPQLRLVFHNGAILADPEGILKGAWPDRRLTTLASMAEVEACRAALEGVVREWIRVMGA